jgi:uncharacterized membrane protein YjgN (DUF898 family)
MLSDKEFKYRQDVNEILSLKYHILHYIFKVNLLDLHHINISKVVNVLELLSDKKFKYGHDVKEIFSLKVHIFHYILKLSLLDLLSKNVGVLKFRQSLVKA